MNHIQDAIASGTLAPAGATASAQVVSAEFAQDGDGGDIQNLGSLDPDDDLSNDEIKVEIRERFNTFEECVGMVFNGSRHAAIVSGPAGCGKSYVIEKLEPTVKGRFFHVTGTASAIGLYKTMWAARDNGVIAFDDCDDILLDDTALNLLKGGLDTKKVRKVSWLKESNRLVDEDGEPIPQNFEFCGRIVFMTNLDLDALVERGLRLAIHHTALMERAGHLSLQLHTRRRQALRIMQVAEDSDLMVSQGVKDPEKQEEILNFLLTHRDNWRSVSIRTLVQLCEYAQSAPTRWKVHAIEMQMKPAKRRAALKLLKEQEETD
jgi:hypothetical protein